MSYPYYYVLLNILLWNIIYISFLHRTVKRGLGNFNVVGRQYILSRKEISLILLFALFAFHTGDYVHYQEEIARISINLKSFSHMESFYIWLTHIVHGSYFLWRLVVFGGFLYISYQTLKEWGSNNNMTLFLFVALVLPMAVEGRYILGYSLFLYGFTLLIKNTGRKRLFGILCLFGSYFLHKSIFLLFLLIPFSYIHLKKWKIVILILLFPILLSCFDLFLKYFLSGQSILTSLVMETVRENYLNKDTADIQQASSIGVRILQSFQYSVYGILLLFLVFRNSKVRTSKLSSRFISLAFFICYVSLLIKFSILNNETMFRRYFILIPYPLICVCCFYLRKKIFHTHAFWWFAVICFIWQNYYMFLQMFYFSFR